MPSSQCSPQGNSTRAQNDTGTNGALVLPRRGLLSPEGEAGSTYASEAPPVSRTLKNLFLDVYTPTEGTSDGFFPSGRFCGSGVTSAGAWQEGFGKDSTMPEAGIWGSVGLGSLPLPQAKATQVRWGPAQRLLLSARRSVQDMSGTPSCLSRAQIESIL